jgi:3-deoxy-7-phosphoheptulonate synthase
LDWVQHSPLAVEYQARVDAIGEALRFMETLAGAPIHDFERVDFYTSHEALVLHYEQAQTRTVPRHTGYFNLSTHFPWIGLRTAQLEGAHVEYCKGLQNPIGVKVGAGMDAAWLKGLCEALNPQREVGKLVFIHRFGAAKIADHLPKMLDVLQGEPIVWLCDPMHGNTQSTSNGYKTRAFEDVASEVEQAFALHRAHHSRLHGVHLELTGEDVTECIGGARGLVAQDLERAYTTTVDPRLNYEQALELALKIVKWA